MPSTGDWPQSLRDFANRAFASCTDANRQAVSDELKALIFRAFQDGTLYTTDWQNTKLNSLESGGSKRAAASSKSYARAATGAAPGPSPRPPPNPAAAAAPGMPPGVALGIPPGMPPSMPPGVPPGMPPMRPGFPPRMPPGGPPVASPKRTARLPVSRSPGSRSPAPRSPGIRAAAMDPGEEDRRAKRMRRFEADKEAFEREQQHDMQAAIASTSLAGRLGAAGGSPAPMTPPAAAGSDPNVIDWDEYTVVGTSTKLEKPYLRLTSAPDPKTVRPLSTLRQTLELLKQKWRAEGNYAYICDQLKSVRQDLTVQRIKNDFTVKVYEIHARIALEKGDLGEYNQCQSQLRTLYALGLPGCSMEFLAYRVLYLLHTRNQREVNHLMSELTPEAKAEPAVAHALAVRAAMRAGNFHRLSALYHDAPNMNAYIMDHFVERERVRALLVVARAFRPSCPLAFLARELGMDSATELDALLARLGAQLYTDASAPLDDAQWDTKQALAPLEQAAARFRKVDIKGQV